MTSSVLGAEGKTFAYLAAAIQLPRLRWPAPLTYRHISSTTLLFAYTAEVLVFLRIKIGGEAVRTPNRQMIVPFG